MISTNSSTNHWPLISTTVCTNHWSVISTNSSTNHWPLISTTVCATGRLYATQSGVTAAVPSSDLLRHMTCCVTWPALISSGGLAALCSLLSGLIFTLRSRGQDVSLVFFHLVFVCFYGNWCIIWRCVYWFGTFWLYLKRRFEYSPFILRINIDSKSFLIKEDFHNPVAP